MRTRILSIFAVAALAFAVIVSISSHAKIVANDATGGLQAADILGLTKSARDLPVQEYPAH